MRSTARRWFPLGLVLLLAVGLPAQAAKKPKPAGFRYQFTKGKVWHYTVKAHETFKETDPKGAVAQRAYDGTWKTDLICGEKHGERTPVAVFTRLVDLKLVSFQKDGQEGPAQDRAVLEKAVSGEEKRSLGVAFLDDFGGDEQGRGPVFGSYYHGFLGGWDAFVLPSVLPKPNRPWTREKVYGMGKYAFTYKVLAKPETKLKQKCTVIAGEAKASSAEGASEYPKSKGFKTKLWFSQTTGLMVALEVEGTVQFYAQEERVKKLSVELSGTEDLGPKMATDQATKAFFDGLALLAQKRSLAALERFSTMTAYSTEELAEAVGGSLYDEVLGETNPVYPAEDFPKVEPDLKGEPEVLSRLIQRAPDAKLRARAAYYLGLSKDANAVKLLTEALEDKAPQARWEASGALVQKMLQGVAVPDTAVALMLKSKDPVLVTRGAAIASRTKREKLLGKYKVKFELCKVQKPQGYKMKEGETSIPADKVETWKKPDPQMWSTRRVGIVKQEFSQGELKGHYALYIPETYCESRQYPLIIYLAGGRGDGEYDIGFWPNHVVDKGYFVACPVAGGKFWWQEGGAKKVLAVLADLKAKYNIDENRVYLMGMSNGGLGTDYIATRYPDLFAAAAPIAGNPVDEATEDDDPAMLRNLRNVPLRIMHGEADPVIPVGADRVMKARLDSLGYSAEYVETPGLGHDLRFGEDGRAKEYLEALAFFEKKERNPFPKKVSGVMAQPGWRYWVRVDSLSGKASFDVEIKKNNVIEVKSQGVGRMTFFLNKALLDLSKAVTVMANGKEVFKGTVKTDKQVLIDGVKAREDRTMVFWAKLPVTLK